MPQLEKYLGKVYLWPYIPNLPAAISFATLFLLLALAQTWKMYRTKLWFCIPFVLGGLCTKPLPFPSQFLLLTLPTTRPTPRLHHSRNRPHQHRLPRPVHFTSSLPTPSPRPLRRNTLHDLLAPRARRARVALLAPIHEVVHAHLRPQRHHVSEHTIHGRGPTR